MNERHLNSASVESTPVVISEEGRGEVGMVEDDIFDLHIVHTTSH